MPESAIFDLSSTYRLKNRKSLNHKNGQPFLCYCQPADSKSPSPSHGNRKAPVMLLLMWTWLVKMTWKKEKFWFSRRIIKKSDSVPRHRKETKCWQSRTYLAKIDRCGHKPSSILHWISVTVLTEYKLVIVTILIIIHKNNKMKLYSAKMEDRVTNETCEKLRKWKS